MSRKVPEYLKPAGGAVFKDRGVTKVGEIVQSWTGEQVEGYGILGLPLSKPSISHSGASFAPQSIRKALYSTATYAIEEELDLAQTDLWDLGDVNMHVTDLKHSHQRIRQTVEEIIRSNPRMLPIFLGGDHSISCPTLQGYIQAKNHESKKVGIIQFDAHHDLRNLEDGGPSNGTPFRGLLDSETIKGEQLIQIGIRNFSNGEMYHQYAQEQDIQIYTMKDVRERAIQDILDESIQTLKQKVDLIYVSVDMDVLDQSVAPGCPAIGPGGMDSQTLLQAIQYLAQSESVQGMDIVEIDPTLDFRDMTSRIAAHVILQFLLGKRMNK